jgi:hypothetical protein
MCYFESQRARGALMAACMFLVAGCGGGDDAPKDITFTVSAVVPDVSIDINGGDPVTVRGTGFLAVTISRVTFGAQPGIIERSTITDTAIEVTTPPAPGGVPGTVEVMVVTVEAGSKFVPGRYTYVATSGSPQPQTIAPATFTPTGAQDFTIGGANLGPPGGSIDVTFSGVGTVRGTVSADSASVTGRAPVSVGAPSLLPVTVTVDTGTATADVPMTVSYDHGPPVPVPAPFQAANGASRPVRLDNSSAVMCTSGTDLTWGNGNDDVLIIRGPPSPGATRVTLPGGGAVGFLDLNNSVPAVLDANTICVYSVGPNGVPDGPLTSQDDTVVVITGAQTTPVVTMLAIGPLNTAPFARISSGAFAVGDAGGDKAPGTGDDMVRVYTPAFAAVAAFPVADLDITPGRTNFSIPFSPDGDTVFVMSAGLNGTPGDADDQLTRFVISTGVSTLTPVPFAQVRPHAISPALLVAPGAGSNGPGTAPDDLIVITPAGSTLNVVTHALAMPLDTLAVVPFAPLGAGGVALPVQGGTPVLAFTDPVGNVSAPVSLTGTPLLAPLGSGDLVVFAPGTAATGDEQAIRLLGDASSIRNFATVPTLNQATVVLSDADRAFGVAASGGGSVIVHQSRALGALTDTSILPAAPITGAEPFVPIGTNWGLVQSPGPTGLFGTGTDAVLVVRY